MENGEINDCKCQDMILEDSKEEANDKSTTFLPLGQRELKSGENYKNFVHICNFTPVMLS